MLITFSGLDGSGKSTQSQMAQTYLTGQGCSVRLLHITHWTWVNRIGEFFFKQKVDQSSSAKAGTSRLWLPQLLMMFVDVARFWLYLRYFQKRGQVLICDRYFYDLGVQALYTQVMSPSLVSIYWKLVPRPTLAFWLQVQPAVARLREDEHQPAYYEAKAALYRQVVSCYPTIQVIPGATVVETQQIIVNLIQQHVSVGIDSA